MMHRQADESRRHGLRIIGPKGAAGRRGSRPGRLLLLAGPLALLAVVVGLVLLNDPVRSLRGHIVPVEELAVESVHLSPDQIEARVRNVGSTPLTIAQVLVNEAYWNHTLSDRDLARLESATVTIAYQWEEGLPLHLGFVTAAGSRLEHEIPVALSTPARDLTTTSRYVGIGALIGLVPVAIGMLWYPGLRRLSRRVRDVVLAVTVGLLAFLLVDTLEEALHAAGQTGAAINGLGLVAVGAAFMIGMLVLIEDVATHRANEEAPRGQRSGLTMAYVLALAIGLHNFGEGLAVGASAAVGEVALGATLLVGFIVHNSTEGLAIALPIAMRDRVRGWHFVGLVLVAGAPAIPGTLLGSWSIAPAWSAIAFGVAAGALIQVLLVVGRSLAAVSDRRTVAAGVVFGVATMYATGLLAAS